VIAIAPQRTPVHPRGCAKLRKTRSVLSSARQRYRTIQVAGASWGCV